MRSGWIAVLILVAGGCAARHAQPPTAAIPVYQEAPAVALAFDPPVTAGQPPVILPRDVRNPGIFVGFEELTTTFFYIRTDDRQDSLWGDRYDRCATYEKVGVSYR